MAAVCESYEQFRQNRKIYYIEEEVNGNLAELMDWLNGIKSYQLDCAGSGLGSSGGSSVSES